MLQPIDCQWCYTCSHDECVRWWTLLAASPLWQASQHVCHSLFRWGLDSWTMPYHQSAHNIDCLLSVIQRAIPDAGVSRCSGICRAISYTCSTDVLVFQALDKLSEPDDAPLKGSSDAPGTGLSVPVLHSAGLVWQLIGQQICLAKQPYHSTCPCF